MLPHRQRSPFLAVERGRLCADGHCLLLIRESESKQDVRNRVRRHCRDLFREHKIAEILFANLFEVIGSDVDGHPSGQT